MQWASVVLLAATGCRSILGFEEPVVIDAARDAASDAACDGWSIRGFDSCALPASAASLVLASGTYVLDTNTNKLVDGNGAAVPVTAFVLGQLDATSITAVVVDELAIAAGAQLRLVGTRPVLVAAWSSITIDGTIDIGSHLADQLAIGRLGAGANASCGAHDGGLGADGMSTGGSGGGGGGALRGAGGGGGTGDNAMRAGGASGIPVVLPAMVVRGGCAGGRSGQAGSAATLPAGQSTRSTGGAGGGAIQLAARTRITISASGRVLAGGAGGQGAPLGSGCGGGGGGAGGYIGLDAATVEVAGTVAANGGGGGGGAEFNATGNDGEDGAASSSAANGGAAMPCGLAGAPGAASSVLSGATATGTNTCGGGGGGGGAGFVMAWSPRFTDQGATFSPPALLNP